MKKGKFIVIYGANGIGKSTQINKLVDSLNKKNFKASYLKYPVYDLEPEGPFINSYLRDPDFRSKNELTTEELQQKYAQNRFRFEPELINKLKSGEWIVAEDYTGTGIAWGLTWGADLEFLEEMNEGLLQPDVSILLHGKRFGTDIEKKHRNEQDEERMRISRNYHLLLADRYNWSKVKANQKIDDVHKDIWREIRVLNDN